MNRREFALGTVAMAVPGTAARHRIIDAQVHVWTNDPHYPWAPGTKDPPKDDRTPAMLLELMRANHVERTVIAQYIGYRWDNRYALDSMRKYAPYFRGVCRVDPTDPAAPDQLSHLTAQGFHGVRLSPTADAGGDWINGPLMPPLWKRAESLKVPMQIYAPIVRMPDLAHLLELCPDLNVVIDHMADCPLDRPDLLKLLLDLARYPKVFVKISDMWVLSKQPYPFADAQEQVKRLLAKFSAQRLMWATNWPVSLQQLEYNRIVDLYRDHFSVVSRKEHEEILGGTVQRVWPFEL